MKEIFFNAILNDLWKKFKVKFEMNICIDIYDIMKELDEKEKKRILES